MLPIVKNVIQRVTYSHKGMNWIDFHGTRGDYQVPMQLRKITPKGHLKLTEYTGTLAGGIPSNPRGRMAKLHLDQNEPYWFISDGTGSLVLRERYFKPDRKYFHIDD